MSLSGVSVSTFTIAILAGSVAIFASVLLYLSGKPALSKNAPTLTTEAWPVIGSLQFFTKRWDFMQRSMAKSETGNFTFYAGQHQVVGITGEEARKVFLESKQLDLSEGYAALLGGSPGAEVKKDDGPFAEAVSGSSDFSAYFRQRLVNMLKGNQLKTGLPRLLQDARASLDKLVADTSGVTDPFDSIYRLVFQFTMRTVACNEIADDAPLLERTLELYEAIESAGTPWAVMYPWLPLPSKAKRAYAGAQLYMIFKRVVDARNQEGRREDDALQYLMDQGDNIKDIITFVLGALFAGQLNSGINAAWILIYLASKPHWLEQVREEVAKVASRYCADDSMSLKDRLMHVPIQAWEAEFPLVDLCLKDSIRLQSSGSAFRRNISGHPVPLNKAGTEVVPANAYVAFPLGVLHYNPEIYESPDEWDPSRYMPGKEEHKKAEYGFLGWGAARHPCLGMRFAKLENTIIVAFFVAYFDEIKLSDAQGNETTRIPRTNRNTLTALKPTEKVYLKYNAAS
ncbi:hypothetical protein LTR08_006134 [Meristemomyces frigidus]|nr:hypothetical protein LTR08_006134 [Meristemomyces frigidus]